MNIKTDYKLICWAIWLMGTFIIAIATYFNTTFLSGFPGNFLIATLVSSIPFALLAIYTKKVYENKHLDQHLRKLRLFGILGAFVSTVLYAIWAFSASMEDAFNPAGFFWVLAVKSIFIGALVGVVVYGVVTKIANNLGRGRDKGDGI